MKEGGYQEEEEKRRRRRRRSACALSIDLNGTTIVPETVDLSLNSHNLQRF
jgi:hypothetical protein